MVKYSLIRTAFYSCWCVVQCNDELLLGMIDLVPKLIHTEVYSGLSLIDVCRLFSKYMLLTE